MARSRSEVSAHDVADYFARRLAAPVAIKRLHRTFPGVSRETWLVDAEVGGEARGFVLRLDPPGGASVPQTLRHEWEVYRRLWLSPIPVAEPLWFDEGIEFAGGRAHMVRRLVEGSTHIPGLTDSSPAGERLRHRVVTEHVEKLAQLHRLDWQAHGFAECMPVPATPADALRDEFTYWKDRWTHGRTEPFPFVTEALYWLEEHLPTDTPRVSLVKGNNGVGEEIWRDGKIVAMSDWELASLGDGALDLAFSQGTLALHDFGAALKHYEACVGHTVSAHRLAFCMFWVIFKAMVCLNAYLLPPFLRGEDRRMTGPAFGLVFVKNSERRLAACIGKDLVEAWREISGGWTSTYAGFAD